MWRGSPGGGKGFVKRERGEDLLGAWQKGGIGGGEGDSAG